MRLYALAERWGKLVRTPFAPRVAKTPEEDLAEVQKALPGVAPWEELQWVLPVSWAFQMGKFLTLYFFRVYGATGAANYWMQVDFLMKWQAEYLLAVKTQAVVTKLAMFVILPLILLGILYITNPEDSEFTVVEELPRPYLMRYEGKIWWAELVAITLKGKAIYHRCDQARACILLEKRRDWTRWGPLDHWYFGEMWVEYKPKFLDHKTWYWYRAWVDYIGFLVPIGEDLYQLQAGYSDPTVAEGVAGWMKPVSDYCDFRRAYEF